MPTNFPSGRASAVANAPQPINKILIANRGEIALRIHRACREMGIKTVAVHSTADADAMHVRLADEAICIGPASATDSYLNVPNIISAAEIAQADAIHPGYGFLSENARFAEIVEEHNIIWIGPSPDHIRRMGDKIEGQAHRGAARAAAGARVRRSVVEGVAEAIKIADAIGYPGAGQGRVGRRRQGHEGYPRRRVAGSAGWCRRARRRRRHSATTPSISRNTCPNRGTSEFLRGVRRRAGRRAIHLGERDCSLQRRHQKMLEEAPSPALSPTQRAEMGEIVRQAVAKSSAIAARGPSSSCTRTANSTSSR